MKNQPPQHNPSILTISAKQRPSKLPPLPANISIQPCTTPSQLAGLRRLNTVLLPIPYPPRFYSDILSEPDSVGRLTRVAVVREEEEVDGSGSRSLSTTATRDGNAEKGVDGTNDQTNEGDDDEDGNVGAAEAVNGKVIGGIRCRLEVEDGSSPNYGSAEQRNGTPDGSDGSGLERMDSEITAKIYIQTLAVLAPYRELGVARHLLEGLLRDTLLSPLTTLPCTDQSSSHKDPVSSGLGSTSKPATSTSTPFTTAAAITTTTTNTSAAKGPAQVSNTPSIRITEIYAHVWEENEEALEWYRKRGFSIGDVMGGYYRRLRPSGARTVRRAVGIADGLP